MDYNQSEKLAIISLIVCVGQEDNGFSANDKLILFEILGQIGMTREEVLAIIRTTHCISKEDSLIAIKQISKEKRIKLIEQSLNIAHAIKKDKRGPQKEVAVFHLVFGHKHIWHAIDYANDMEGLYQAVWTCVNHDYWHFVERFINLGYGILVAPSGRRYLDKNIGTDISYPFGKYYTFDDAQKLCPPGARLPTSDEVIEDTEWLVKILPLGASGHGGKIGSIGYYWTTELSDSSYWDELEWEKCFDLAIFFAVVNDGTSIMGNVTKDSLYLARCVV